MITLLRFSELLDTYGADPERWPLEDRVAATDLLARSSEARALARRAAEIDALLDSAPLTVPSAGRAESLTARIAAALPAVQPAIAIRFGWPNWVALAAASVAGLVIGWSGLSIGTGSAAAETADLLAPVPALEDVLW